MGKLYNCNKTTILNYAKQIGYVNKCILTEEDKLDIINQYENKTSTELANKYNVSISLIAKIWRTNNLFGKNKRRYPFNYNYFEVINSPDKAYFLGLIAADGNVFKRENENTQAIIKLCLQKEDKYILEIFKTYINSEQPLYTQEKKNKTYTNYHYSLELVSDKMASDLSKYNIIPSKTYNYEMIILSRKCMSHYFRGYFDGDGSIICSNNMWHSPSQYHISIAGFEHNLQKMKEYLENELNILSTVIIDNRQNKYKMPFGSLNFVNIKEKYKFIQYIYEDCRDIFISRKKYKADCFINAIKQNYSNKQNIYNNLN